MTRRETAIVFSFTVLLALILALPALWAQQQISGGAVTLNAGSALAGKFGIDQTTPGTTNGVQVNAALPAGTNVIGHVIHDSGSTTAVTGTVAVTGTFWQATQPVSIATAPALVTSTANVGIVRAAPTTCTQATNFTSSTVGVATGAGTSVSSTTTCITAAYVNNITNSAVTFRLQDKTGTPIIWVGGNADFSIAANGNVQFPLTGVLMTGGITAIAGTASALNLQVNGLQ